MSNSTSPSMARLVERNASPWLLWKQVRGGRLDWIREDFASPTEC